MIQFANELINNRLTWFGTLQGLLLAALAFAWKDPGASALALIFCFLGAAVAVSIGLATYRANQAIDLLEARFDSLRPEGASEIETVGLRSRSGLLWWLMPGYFVPWLFCAGWLVIALDVCVCRIW